jgi:hypothetical protein
MANRQSKILVNFTHEIEERLNIIFQARPEVPEEVEYDSDTNQTVLFVIRGEHVHCYLQEVLDKGTKHFSVRKAVEDLHHDVPELVLRVINGLRLCDLI